MAIETLRFHNPIIKPGFEVVSQSLADEKLGLATNTGHYLLKLDPVTNRIKLIGDGPVVDFELEDFMRSGILGEERFTVIMPEEKVDGAR